MRRGTLPPPSTTPEVGKADDLCSQTVVTNDISSFFSALVIVSGLVLLGQCFSLFGDRELQDVCL